MKEFNIDESKFVQIHEPSLKPLDDPQTVLDVLLEKNTKTMSEWISVKDRPPPPMQTVILCIDGIVIPGWNESTQPEEDPSYCTWEGQFGLDHVTHWMPLPELPTT